jgi:hypothetical protein
MHKSRLWISRIVVLYAPLIFSFLAYLYVVEPLAHIAKFGITASGVPESINFLRAGPGALFSGMAVDGVTPIQISELRDEGLSWLLFVAALLAHPRAQR